MKKDSAVEWLVEQYKKVGGISISMAEIAKEMEKEQIVKAYHKGEFNAISNRKLYETSEQYYVKTYK